jgi:long-chain acyl-CoA synthetase
MHPSHFAKSTPDKPAFIMAGSGEVVTYLQLEQRSNQIAQLFRSLGLQPDDHIAIHMENNRHFMEIVWAAQRSGIIYTAISTHLREEEIAYIVDNCEAKVLISSIALGDLAGNIRSRCNGLQDCFMVGGTSHGYLSLDEAIESQPNTPIDDEERGLQMLYSSGTTGRPKGVLPKRASGESIQVMTPSAATLGVKFGFGENTVYLSPAPLYHAAPLTYNTITMHSGGTSIIMERFDAERSLELIEKYQITHSQWVPIMFIRMLRLDEKLRTQFDFSSHKVAIHAAAPCPIEIKQQMIAWWGPIINEYYGSTEGMGFTALNSEQWLSHPGSVGPPLGCRIKILDDEGQELPDGEIGTVYFADRIGDFSYYGEPEKTAACISPEGWGTVGDAGYLDDDGYLYLSDRKDFMIISGGVNIYPQEIENQLILHNAVADVAVFGIPNTEFGEEVKAVVQPIKWPVDEKTVEQELLIWLRGFLSPVKAPRSIDFVQELPRLDNGKLYKRYLQQQYRDKAKLLHK